MVQDDLEAWEREREMKSSQQRGQSEPVCVSAPINTSLFTFYCTHKKIRSEHKPAAEGLKPEKEEGKLLWISEHSKCDDERDSSNEINVFCGLFVVGVS